jgi:periplasmic protein TonB
VIALTAEDFADLRRWTIAGMVVAIAYAGAATAMVQWHEAVNASEAAGAIVVEFAPEQVAAPEQVQSDAVPDKPIEKVEQEPPPQVEAKSELPVEQKVEPKPREEQPRDAVPVTTPPLPEAPVMAALPAAPVQGTPNEPVDPRKMQMWVGEIAAKIERNKRHYRIRQPAVAEVSFTLDKGGRLIDSKIAKSTGAADLDAEALALLNRAQPFPPAPAPPHSEPDQPVRLTVSIRFSLK